MSFRELFETTEDINAILPDNYYHSVTGQIVAGDNKQSPEFSFDNTRYYINQPQEIITQGSSWDDQVKSDSTPYYDITSILADFTV